MASRVFAVDLGAWSVKLAIASPGLRGAVLTQVIERLVPPGDEPADVRARRVLASLVDELRLRDETGYLGVYGDQVFTQVLEFGFKSLRRAELDKAVGGELEGVVPVDLEDMVYCFEQLPPTPAVVAEPDAEAPRGRVAPPSDGMRVLTYAMRRERAEALIELARQCHFEARGLLACGGAAARLVERTPSLAKARMDGPVAVIDIGHDRTDVIVVSAGKAVFSRSLARGGRQVTEAIARHWRLEFAKAETAKHGDGFVASQGEPASGEAWAKIHAVTITELQPFARDIRQTLVACRARTGFAPIAALLVGGGAKLRGMGSFMTEQLAIPAWRPTADDITALAGPRIGAEAAAGMPIDSGALTVGMAYDCAGGRPQFDLRSGVLAVRVDLSFLRSKAVPLIASVVTIAAFVAGAASAELYSLQKSEKVLKTRLQTNRPSTTARRSRPRTSSARPTLPVRRRSATARRCRGCRRTTSCSRSPRTSRRKARARARSHARHGEGRHRRQDRLSSRASRRAPRRSIRSGRLEKIDRLGPVTRGPTDTEGTKQALSHVVPRDLHDGGTLAMAIQDKAREFWDRISPRERMLVAIAGVATPIILALWLALSIHDGLDDMEARNDKTRHALVVLADLQARGAPVAAPVDDVVATMGTEPISLDTYLNKAALKAEFTSEHAAAPGGHAQRLRDDVGVAGFDPLSIDELKTFLQEIETASKVVVVTHLEITKNRSKPDKVNAQMDVSSTRATRRPTPARVEARAGAAAASAAAGRVAEMAMNLRPSARVAARYVGIVVATLIVFVIALQLSFPYDRIKTRLVDALSEKYDVTVGDLDCSWVPGRFALKAVTLRTRQVKPDDPVTTFYIERLDVDVHFWPALHGTGSVDVDAKIGSGHIAGNVSIGKGESSVHLDGHELPGVNLPMRELVGLPMSGEIDFSVALDLPNETNKLGKRAPDWSLAEGEIDFSCPTGCSIGDGHTKLKPKIANTRSAAFAADGIEFGKVDIQSLFAEVSITPAASEGKTGSLKLKRFELKSLDGELKLDYAMALTPDINDSVVTGCLGYHGSDVLNKREPKTYAELQTIGPKIGPDGLFHIKLTDKFREMRRLPTTTCNADAPPDSTMPSVITHQRPNLAVTPPEPKPNPVTTTPTPPPGPPPVQNNASAISPSMTGWSGVGSSGGSAAAGSAGSAAGGTADGSSEAGSAAGSETAPIIP